MVNEAIQYDVAVIGGGVNGAGIARDAAGRGAKVLLLEKDDLAQGTSSRSTKLIHGGLRYLEHFEFGLVREALAEREILWAMAPHIIWPLRFILPYRKGLRPRWLLRLGLFLYDHIGGRKKLPPAKSVKLERHPAGIPLKPELVHAFEYSDGWVDDARLVALTAQDAARLGADIHTRMMAENFIPVPGGWKIEAVDENGNQREFTARAIVNAAGPYALQLLEEAHIKPEKHMRLVRGSHIVVPKLFDHDYAYFFQLPDGRIFFAIPYERDFTLIGTTDQDHHGPIGEAQASAEEIAYLCEGINLYFRKEISPDDVVWTYSGVRPLIDDQSGRPEAATRGYSIELNDRGHAPLLNIFGGKITSHRHLAEEAVDRLAEIMPEIPDRRWTRNSSLPGGDFPVGDVSDLIAGLSRQYPFLAPATIDRIFKAYGTNCHIWLGDAATAGDLGTCFGHNLYTAEVDYLIEREWAKTAEDILWRRSKLGLHFDAKGVKALSAYVQKKRKEK